MTVDHDTDGSGPDQGFAAICTRCGRGLVSKGEWCCGDFTPTDRAVDWDSAAWGQPGHNVHTSAWAPDGTHDDVTEDQ